MNGFAPAPPVPIPEGPVVGKLIQEPPEKEVTVRPPAIVVVPVILAAPETERLVIVVDARVEVADTLRAE
jgi:hypothetical protein